MKLYSRGSAAAHGYHCCQRCGLLETMSRQHCSRCHYRLSARKSQSLQRCWAFLITALLLYIPANTQPIMLTEVLGDTEPSTIIGGIILLFDMGSWPIALVIFIASVIVPLGKILALIWLCLSVSIRSSRWPRQRSITYRLTELVGRWSMVDVFVVTILVSLIQLGALMSIYPGAAALSFAGVVIFTMLAANSFDPRLIWDHAEQSTHTEYSDDPS